MIEIMATINADCDLIDDALFSFGTTGGETVAVGAEVPGTTGVREVSATDVGSTCSAGIVAVYVSPAGLVPTTITSEVVTTALLLVET